MISFLVVGAHWRAHHRVFRYLGRVDRVFVQLNFAWLLIIVATPFLTEIIREGELTWPASASTRWPKHYC